jgi:hypothetical protein
MVSLKSAGVARVLLWLLRILLALTVIETILKLIVIALPTTPPIITALQHLLTVPWVIVPLIVIALALPLLSLVWIYRLHDDLNQCYISYPIDAWDALARFILPGYNIWGIWNTLITIARHFQAEKGRLRRYGLLLHHLVRVMYGIFIALYLLDQLRYRDEGLARIEPIINIPDSLIPVAIAGKELLGLGGGFVLLAITQTIVNAMQLKVHQINHAEETAHL